MKSHFLLLAVALFLGASRAEIKLKSIGTYIELQCDSGNITITQNNEKQTVLSPQRISKRSDTDSAQYSCQGSHQTTAYIFIKRCLNCVDFDIGSIVGVVIGDLIAIILIAVAVYSISSPTKLKIHRASDRQALVPNDDSGPIYTGIKQSEKQEYSRLEFRSKK
ncbi:T-cell surface glycoprotein CD3 delta chain-like isoform X3 [Scyliorhinus torazame]|uniref:T-cell surface glycoprotein CD3 delta chain-like isoform X3 n=1 Tax=Scyliorhinus torazame TaxID=75743 RepID=UPI003B59315E